MTVPGATGNERFLRSTPLHPLPLPPTTFILPTIQYLLISFWCYFLHLPHFWRVYKLYSLTALIPVNCCPACTQTEIMRGFFQSGFLIIRTSHKPTFSLCRCSIASSFISSISSTTLCVPRSLINANHNIFGEKKHIFTLFLTNTRKIII